MPAGFEIRGLKPKRKTKVLRYNVVNICALGLRLSLLFRPLIPPPTVEAYYFKDFRVINNYYH